MRAFKDIASSVANAKLLIVGDGYLKESLEQEARNLHIEEKVIFAGSQKDMPSLYKAMDIFVLPSLTEGMSLVLLEAMSMGLPVIATNVGSAPYIIGDGEGMLISCADVSRLSKAIASLINDSGARKSMGLQARNRVGQSFSLDSFAAKYVQVYRMVAGSRSSSL